MHILLDSELLQQTKEAKFLVPDWGDIVESGIG